MLRKKLTITVLFFLVPVLLSAQPYRPQNIKATKTSGHELVVRSAADQTKSLSKVSTVAGDVIGYTYYDYMTNGGLGDRIVWFEDGTIMVGTMAGVDATDAVATRGSYYQYYNGTNWLDTTTFRKLETGRRGWTTLGAFYAEKVAVIFSHVAAELNINLGTPEAPSWTPQTVPGTAGWSWPKMATDDGADGSLTNIYAIGGSSAGLPVPFIRSTDAGGTWEPIKELVDTNSAAWQEGYVGVGADDAIVTARNGKVAVFNFTTQANCVLYVSEDQGATFTSTTVLDAMAVDAGLDAIEFDSSFFPAQKFKMLGIGYSDGTGDVHIDANGKVHVAWGNYELGYYIDTDSLGNPVRENGALTRTFFVTDMSSVGVGYWNEDMSAPIYIRPAGKAYDMSFAYSNEANGYPVTLQAGLDVSSLGMPTMGSDADGNLYMVVQGFAANDLGENDGTQYPFGHVYMTRSTDGGATWATITDIYGNVTGEDVLFPSIPDRIWDATKIPVLVQNDQNPGTWLQQADHPQNRDLFIVNRFDATQLTVDVNDDVVENLSYKLDQNYPNPFNPSTAITFSVPEAGNVSLKIYDMLGREVATLINGSMNAGSHTVSFNAENLSSGMYLYTLNAGNFTSSKKMMLLK